MWRTWKDLQCDGIYLAHHFFDVGHSGDALNGQQQIAEDIGSKGYSYSIENCVGVLTMQYRSDSSAIFVSGLLIRCHNLASFTLCGLIVEVVSTTDSCYRSLNISISITPHHASRPPLWPGMFCIWTLSGKGNVFIGLQCDGISWKRVGCN